MLKLGKILLFLLINLFNFQIADVAFGYLNLDFSGPFLRNRLYLEDNTLFKVGLIVHGIAACTTLFLCSILVLFRLEKINVNWHRLLGKISTYLLFIFVIPGGLILSYFAFGGKLGKLAFFLLSTYTFLIGFKAVRLAKSKQIKLHRLYMTELLCLLSSAILLRIFLLLFQQTSLDPITSYNTCVLLSWLPAVILFLFLKKQASYNQFNENNVI